jgi:hypothetical protein
MSTQFKTLSFTGGMDTDLDKALRDGSNYLRAENFTFTSVDGGNVGALENTKGNELDSTIVFDSGQEVIGYANIVKNTVYFTTDGAISNIYYHEEGVGTTLKYTDASSTAKLNFSLDPKNRIIAIGRQELLDLEKVYWVDGINEYRFIDLNKDYIGLEATALNAIPPNDITADVITTAITGSGSYTAGTVYHTYQFYNINGAASTISSVSDPVKLSQYTGLKDGGNEKDEDANCSVQVEISNIEQSILDSYNRIRIYAIHYTDIASPVIGIVTEQTLVDDDLIVFDTGNHLGTIEVDEFVSYNQTSYIPEAIASKNNTLFIGNLAESTFTDPILDDPTDPNYWDARAYRFNSGATSGKIVDAAESTYIEVDSTTFKVATTDVVGVNPGDRVPYDYDCLNLYNDIFTDNLTTRNANNGYKYKADGITLGGEGENVSYRIKDIGYVLDTATEWYDIGSTDNVVNQNTSNEVIECQDGEVYRVGIVFYNSKGQKSFAKWIGDILWEEELSSDRVYYGLLPPLVDNTLNVKKKVLEVTVSNLPTGVASWQIVRAKRNSIDKTVVSNGAFVQTQTDTNTSYNGERPVVDQWLDVYDPAKTLFKYVSPETTFNEPDNYNITGHKFRIYNKYGNHISWSHTFGTSGIFFTGAIKHRELRNIEGASKNYLNNLIDIKEFKYLKPAHKQDSVTDPITVIDGYEYLNQSFKITDLYGGAISSYVVSLNSVPELVIGDQPVAEGQFSASLLKNVDRTRYGGVTYNSFLNTTYIPFSNVIDKGTSVVDCNKGDVYMNMFYYLHTLFQDSTEINREAMQELMVIPVQSSLDLRRRSDRMLDYYIGVIELDGIGTTEDALKVMYIQETVEEGIQFQGSIYDTSIGDLYRYNPAYSAEPIHEVSFPLPFDFIIDKHSTTKVLASEKKINGEAVDQWTNFFANNFIEVDSAYGPLNTLQTVDNNLFFWQDRSFGTLAVNDRSLITDNSGAQLSLGTGTVLERYDYISQQVGNVDKYNIESSENAIFWTYSPKNNICVFDNQLKELSTSNSIKSYMEAKGAILNPITAVDTISNEVVFKLNDEVLVYDLLLGKFIGVYTFIPEWFIRGFGGNYKSSSNSTQFYIHNSDSVNRGSFYGVTYNSTLKHICSDNYNYTKVFDNLEWHSTSLDSSGINRFVNTFDNYRIYNDYQNTDWQNITFERDERSFKTIIPRDVVSQNESANADIFSPANLDGTQKFKRRIRDKYIILDFSYNNNNGYIFSIPFVNVLYRISAR